MVAQPVDVVSIVEAIDPDDVKPNVGYLWIKRLGVEGNYAKARIVATPIATVALSPGSVVYYRLDDDQGFPTFGSSHAFIKTEHVIAYRRARGRETQ